MGGTKILVGCTGCYVGIVAEASLDARSGD